MVVAQGDDVGGGFFYDGIGVAEVPQGGLVHQFALLDGFEAQQFASLGKAAFNLIDSDVARRHGNQIIAQCFCLLEKVYVSGVEAVKCAKNQYSFYHTK